jgi:hypothetical protein
MQVGASFLVGVPIVIVGFEQIYALELLDTRQKLSDMVLQEQLCFVIKGICQDVWLSHAKCIHVPDKAN